MYSVKDYFRRLAEGRENGTASLVLNPFLEIAGYAYGTAVGTFRSLYENRIIPRKRLPFPVISVGNLTWGGTGKTPLVEYLARRLGEKRRNVLILTRGYSHDEVEQLRRHLPRAVLGVGKDRVRIAQKLQKEQRIDLAILDDGLQHWPIERDVELIMVNALNPFGNRKLIPRGVLREPLNILKKATIVVISHSNLVSPEELAKLRDEIRKIAPSAHIVEAYLEALFFYRARKRTRLSPARLQNQRVTTFSAVGTPRSFQLLLSRMGIRAIRNFEFMDHHRYSMQELKEIKQVSVSASADEIITTEKDFYRSPDMITQVLDPLILAARLRIATGEEILTDRLFRLLGVTR